MIEKLRMCAFSDGMFGPRDYTLAAHFSMRGFRMIRAAVMTALLCAASTFAQEPAAAPAPAENAAPAGPPPPADQIKAVVDYLENGKDRGPALLDVVPCLKVDNTKGSPTQYQCVEPVTGPVKKGTTVFAWLQWYCPKDGKYEDVTLQIFHEGTHRQTIDVPVTGFGRTRGWRGANLSKVGKWSLKVFRGTQELGGTTVDVN